MNFAKTNYNIARHASNLLQNLCKIYNLKGKPNKYSNGLDMPLSV